MVGRFTTAAPSRFQVSLRIGKARNFSNAPIVTLSTECERAARNNIQWLFHTNNFSFPMDRWNFAPAYYPGSDYVDWLGLSVYGQQFTDEPWAEFWPLVDWPYQEICTARSEETNHDRGMGHGRISQFRRQGEMDPERASRLSAINCRG